MMANVFTTFMLVSLTGAGTPSSIEWSVTPVTAQDRAERELDDFYQKKVVLHRFWIMGSSRASDNSLREAAWILSHMLEGREDIFHALAQRKVHLTVMAWNEYTTDVPEHQGLKPRVYWDRRARGLGGSPVSCAEENLLCHPGDPYATENILIHEFAHAIHGLALTQIDTTFGPRLNQAFEQAIADGLWHDTYAASNAGEYWAEGVQSWFDNNRQDDALHNHVNTRAELKNYDSSLAALCEEIFGDKAWRYRKPMQRPVSQRVHLLDYDPSGLPRFRWRRERIPDLPHVRMQTTLGTIELELDARRAPRTVDNFLHYVHQGLYNDGHFFRTVTAANQPTDKIRIAVIQGCAPDKSKADLRPPIAIERTRDTGLRHLDGVLSMARDGPDTAQDHFFICVGNQPSLDFGGKRNPDGQGFAAFGRVIKGMDVVRKIHESKADGQQLTPPIRIQRAIRLN